MSANKSALYTIGSYLGKGAAYAVQGTALGTSHLAQGAKAGYVAKADELRARRQALMAKQLVATPLQAGDAIPVPTKQRKLAVKA